MDHPLPSLAERISGFFKTLADRVSRRPGGLAPWEAAPVLPAAVVRLILRRVHRLHRSLSLLAARARVVAQARGSAPSPRPSPGVAPSAAPSPAAVATRARRGLSAHPYCQPGTAAGASGLVLPRRFAWLADVLTDAQDIRDALLALLADAELAAMVECEPRLSRVLRPLAHMMGVVPRPMLVALDAGPSRPLARHSPRPSTRRPWAKRPGFVAADCSYAAPGLAELGRAKPG